MSILILFIVFILLLLFNVPIAVSLGVSAIVSIMYSGITTYDLIISTFVSGMDSFPLLAIPLFLLAGELMGKGGVSKRMFGIANAIVGHQTGGFAMAAVMTCMLFGSIAGSSAATVAAVGGLMIPEMVKRGYDIKFATATISAAGSLGVILPPSVDMIMFGVTSNTSIGDLFIAGILPGIFIGCLLMGWAYIYSKIKGYKGEDRKFSIKLVLVEFWNAKWALLIPFIILGGIYGGFFTPTEAAVIAVVVGFIIGIFVYKEMKLRDISTILLNSALLSAAIFFVVIAANTFGTVLTLERAPVKITEALLGFTSSPLVIIILINLLLLLVGVFMDSVVSIIILTPILFPIAMELGFDPVHFGIMMILNLAIGFITPPIGINLFVGSAISGVSIESLARAAIPYFLVLLLALVVVIFWPDLSLFLLNLLR